MTNKADSLETLKEIQSLVATNKRLLREAYAPPKELASALFPKRHANENPFDGVERIQRLLSSDMELKEAYDKHQRHVHDIEDMLKELQTLSNDIDTKMRNIIWK